MWFHVSGPGWLVPSFASTLVAITRVWFKGSSLEEVEIPCQPAVCLGLCKMTAVGKSSISVIVFFVFPLYVIFWLTMYIEETVTLFLFVFFFKLINLFIFPLRSIIPYRLEALYD